MIFNNNDIENSDKHLEIEDNIYNDLPDISNKQNLSIFPKNKDCSSNIDFRENEDILSYNKNNNSLFDNDDYKKLFFNDYFTIYMNIMNNKLFISNYFNETYDLQNIEETNYYFSDFIIGNGANGIIKLGFDIKSNLPIIIKHYIHIKNNQMNNSSKLSFSYKEEQMYKIDYSSIFIERINNNLILKYIDLSLSDLLNQGFYFYKNEIKYIMVQLCDNVIIFYNNGYIHSDIKPDNILIDDNFIVHIIDRESFINYRDNKNDYPKYITTIWWSCQSANQRAIDKITSISKNADTHSLCIILIHILIGRFPSQLKGNNHEEQNINILNFLHDVNNNKFSILKPYKNLINLSLSFESISPIEFKNILLKFFDNHL